MSVNRAAAARIGAYVLVCGVVGVMALTGQGRARPVEVSWRAELHRADSTLSSGDVRGAENAWQDAYRLVLGARSPEGLLEAGHAYLRIGEAAYGGSVAVAQARRIYLLALVQARARGDAETLARAGEAFAALGDREVAERAFAVAYALATQRRDEAARDRIAALRARTDYAVRTP
jgi:hypothetical protein